MPLVNKDETYVCTLDSAVFTGDYCDTAGYVHKDFVPSTRPGLGAYCYNGARKFDFLFPNRGKIATFEKCPLKI